MSLKLKIQSQQESCLVHTPNMCKECHRYLLNRLTSTQSRVHDLTPGKVNSTESMNIKGHGHGSCTT